jgi:hypothetical protein
MDLEEEFTQALEGTVEAAKARGYIPTYFMQMLSDHGGVETAKRLLAKSEPQTGLFELWNLGILHESMEAVICDNPRFHHLFEVPEIAEAHQRLEELGYFKKGK